MLIKLEIVVILNSKDALGVNFFELHSIIVDLEVWGDAFLADHKLVP